MPVVDTPVHEKVREKEGAVYGCWNKPRPTKYMGYFAPDTSGPPSHRWTRTQAFVQYKFSTECRFDMSLKDPKCNGCEWRGSGEKYDAQVRANGT